LLIDVQDHQDPIYNVHIEVHLLLDWIN